MSTPVSMPSLLGVFAHPDDESLSSGGVLARHAAAGARTAVVTATWTPDTRRGAELAEALRILGAGAPRMRADPDDGVVHPAGSGLPRAAADGTDGTDGGLTGLSGSADSFLTFVRKGGGR